jgi:hypothetical protein
MASRAGSSSSAGRKRCTWPDGCRKLAPKGRKRCDDHNPRRMLVQPAEKIRHARLLGKTEPRLWTKPLRPLTRATSKGFEVIEFAAMIGEPLLPWEQWAAIHALELLPDGSFRFRTILILVARQNGKSTLKRIITLWRMYMTGARRIIGVAQDVALARDQWNMCQETIHGAPDLEEEWGRVRNVNGDEWFEASGCRYGIKAANRRAGRGGSNDEVNIDELREQTDWKAWSAVSKTTMARDNGQIWAMSNAGDDDSVVLNQLRDAALSGRDPSIFLGEWSAEDGCELDDWDQIAQANPGLGYIISESAIRSALATDPPNVYRTEILCQRVDHLDSAIDPAAWKDCADPSGTMDGLRDRIALCFDVAPDSQHATLAAAAQLDDGRVRIEIVKAWNSADEARAELPGLLATVKPAALGWYPTGPAAELGPVLRPAAVALNKRPGKRQPGQLPENGEITGTAVPEACQGLAGLALGRRIVHPADPLLDAHIGGATKLNAGDGWRFVRRGGGHADAAYAAAGAVQIALTMPAPKRARIRMLG